MIRRNPSAGFFSNYFYVLSHIVDVLSSNHDEEYEFFVDMEHNSTPYSELHKIHGTKNAWSYYFSNNSKKIYDYNKVIYKANEFLYNVPCYSVRGRIEVFPSRKMVSMLNEKAVSIFPFNKNVLDFSENAIQSIRAQKTLGIHVRGTDMKVDATHPNPFEIKDLLSFLRNSDVLEAYDKIFISSDEQDVIDLFELEFPGRIVSFPSFRSKRGARGVHTIYGVFRYNHRYKLGLEVVRDVLCLSKCEGLICSQSNVAYAAIVFNNNNYKDLIVFNNNQFIHY